MDFLPLIRRLQLKRPLVVLDIEATGLNPRTARIVDFAVLKLRPDGTHKVFSTLVNPTIPIPPQVTAVHGITDAMVADAPTWKTLGPVMAAGLVGADLMSYAGRRYDLDLMRAETERHDIPMPDSLVKARLVDPYAIWAKLEPRNLDAYLARFGGGQERTVKHRAAEDVAALLIGFVGQLDAMGLPNDVDELIALSGDPDWIDVDGKIAWMGGRPCLTFGEHRGEALQDLGRGTLRWILGKDFSDEVKRICRNALQGRFPVQPNAADDGTEMGEGLDWAAGAEGGKTE